MSTLISAVLSHADKLPLVGAPISNATAILLAGTGNQFEARRKDSAETLCDQNNAVCYRLSPKSTPVTVASPPPPYDNDNLSTLSKLSGYVWKRASFGSQGDAVAAPKAKPAALAPMEPPPALDKNQVEHAVTMINIATEMDNAGNHQMAMDLYMMGLDRIIAALPLDTDPTVKKSFEDKIKQFKDLKKLDLGLAEMRAQYEMSLADGAAGKPASAITFSELIVHAVVLGAVTLKKSPLPVILGSAMACAKAGLLTVDEVCQIRKLAKGLATYGINKAIQIDRRFEIHQMVSDAVYTCVTALVKAGIAYAETPGYNQKELAAAERAMTTSRCGASAIPVM